MSNESKTLALFDFDGTLTTKDSMDEFLKWSVGRKRYFFNLLLFSPLFILYKLKLISNDKAKEKLLALFFKGMSETEFKKKAKIFSLTQIDKILNKETFQILKNHQKNNHRVVIVSASIRCWLEGWCEREKIELLSTELKFIDKELSGRFKTKNCYGEEKVNRIEAYLNLSDYETVYAYGDSRGDKEMLEIADYPEKILSNNN